MRRGPLRSAGQRIYHVLLLIVGWLLFGAFWWQTLRGDLLGDPRLGLLVLGSAVVVPSATLWWVWHNLGIYRRKGPRRTVHSPPEVFETDWEGRVLVFDPQAVKAARRVVIEIDGHQKRFVTADGPPVAAAQSRR